MEGSSAVAVFLSLLSWSGWSFGTVGGTDGQLSFRWKFWKPNLPPTMVMAVRNLGFTSLTARQGVLIHRRIWFLTSQILGLRQVRGWWCIMRTTLWVGLGPHLIPPARKGASR